MSGIWRSIGAGCWAVAPLFFLVQWVTAAASSPPYSLASNSISDLGITSCGMAIDQPDGSIVHICSPRHALMNGAFVGLGLLTIAGALLAVERPIRRRLAGAGLAGVAVAGCGVMLLGAAPGDVAPRVHALGAVLQFPGAAGVLLFGLGTPRARPRRRFWSLLCGTVATLACVTYALHVFPAARAGLVERLAFDTRTVWIGLFGASLLAGLPRQRGWGPARPDAGGKPCGPRSDTWIGSEPQRGAEGDDERNVASTGTTSSRRADD